jgi:hypothetical protein
VLAVVMALVSPARAQSAEAETLFREGKRLLKKGQIAEACDKLEAADRLEPTDGAELNLADCREKNGQLATAWAMFAKAAATAKHAGNTSREAEARRRAAALEPRLIYLTISVPPDSRVDGLVIKRNDTVLDPALWDQRVPVDPGEYQVAADAPGHEPWSTSIVVKTRNKKAEVPALDRRPEPKQAAASHRAARPAPRDPEEAAGDRGDAEPAAPSRFTGTRKLSLVVAAVGLAAAGGGVAFGVHANSLEAQANTTCPGTTCRDPKAVDLNHSARRSALYANIGLAVGGAAVATAVVLWLVGSPRAGDTVSIVPTLGADRVGVAIARGF